ncbi:MAG: DUF4136 domain-containing protein [Alphaproteobacteria bacterium]|nr:MAG: DUF4136 domain-containing protein [Alphaproteobacteria bacterium]
MSMFRRGLARKAILPIAALALVAGCAPTFEARVARFSQLPPPSGQSFVIESRDPEKAGGLEFATYANLVRQRLLANGFVEAASPAQASLAVQLDYNVGPPREKVQTRPGGWGGGWGPEVYSVTQYNSQLAMKIVRSADKASVFEGRAETISTSNNLTKLVPNLVTAIFTNFPGNSGETVRVKFDPTQPAKPATVRPLR